MDTNVKRKRQLHIVRFEKRNLESENFTDWNGRRYRRGVFMRRDHKTTEDFYGSLLDPQWYQNFSMHRSSDVQAGQTTM